MTPEVWTVTKIEDGPRPVVFTATNDLGDEAFVKWDGCFELQRAADERAIHICDLDEFIAKLEGIRALAREKFGPDW